MKPNLSSTKLSALHISFLSKEFLKSTIIIQQSNTVQSKKQDWHWWKQVKLSVALQWTISQGTHHLASSTQPFAIFRVVFIFLVFWLSTSLASLSGLKATASLWIFHFPSLSLNSSRCHWLSAQGLWEIETCSWDHLCPTWRWCSGGLELVYRNAAPAWPRDYLHYSVQLF